MTNRNNSGGVNEKLLLVEIDELCKASGEAIFQMAKDCNIDPLLAAELYIDTMKEILKRTRGKIND